MYFQYTTNLRHNVVYYMEKGILLATKTLIESIRHYIRDPSGVFSVCHAREWYIDKFPPFLLLFFSKWPTSLRFVELIYHFCEQQENVNLLVSASCLLVVIVNAYF